MSNDNVKSSAPAAYALEWARVQVLVAKIRKALDECAPHPMGATHWGHVGDISSARVTLKDVADMLTGEGGYAESERGYVKEDTTTGGN